MTLPHLILVKFKPWSSVSSKKISVENPISYRGLKYTTIHLVLLNQTPLLRIYWKWFIYRKTYEEYQRPFILFTGILPSQTSFNCYHSWAKSPPNKFSRKLHTEKNENLSYDFQRTLWEKYITFAWLNLI